MKDEILKRVDDVAEITSETLAKATDGELERLCEWLLQQDEGRQEKIRKSLANETAWWLNSANSQWKRPGDDGNRRGKKYTSHSDTETDETSEDEDDRGSETGEVTTDPGGSEDDEVKDTTTPKPPDMASKTSLEQDGDGTDEFGDWLFNESAYTEWVKYPQGLLWLHGNCRSSASPYALHALSRS